MKKELITKIKNLLQQNGAEAYLTDFKIVFPENIVNSYKLEGERLRTYIWKIFLSNSQSGIMVTTYWGKPIDLLELDSKTILNIYRTLERKSKELGNVVMEKGDRHFMRESPEAYMRVLSDARKILEEAGRQAGNAEDAMSRRLYTGYTELEEKSRERLAIALVEARQGVRLLEMIIGGYVDFDLKG